MTEARTHVLFEQIERSTVSWQIFRARTVPAPATDSTTGLVAIVNRYEAYGGSWKRTD